MGTAGLKGAFGFSFAREDEFLSQSVLQPDVVPLLNRHFAVPIVDAAIDLKVEFQKWASSGGKEKSKNECHANIKQETDCH